MHQIPHLHLGCSQTTEEQRQRWLYFPLKLPGIRATEEIFSVSLPTVCKELASHFTNLILLKKDAPFAMRGHLQIHDLGQSRGG